VERTGLEVNRMGANHPARHTDTMSNPPPIGLSTRLLPDSSDSRLFVELSSYAADLGEAISALELARQVRGHDGALRDASPYLVDFAAVAYCRTFFPSKVRKPMTDYVAIPEKHQDLHALITAYRNRRVAHSQSQLSSTFAVIAIDEGGSPRHGVFGMTASQELPAEVITQWAVLITTLLESVGDLQHDVEARLNATIAATSTQEIHEWPVGPAISEKFATDFTARDSRGRYPATWAMFWSTAD
jgi:hypothetical protein